MGNYGRIVFFKEVVIGGGYLMDFVSEILGIRWRVILFRRVRLDINVGYLSFCLISVF